MVIRVLFFSYFQRIPNLLLQVGWERIQITNMDQFCAFFVQLTQFAFNHIRGVSSSGR